MRGILPVFALAAALLTASDAAAQRVAVSVSRSESLAGSGYNRGYLFAGNAIRVEVPVRGMVPFVALGRVQDRRRSCSGACGPEELSLELTVGSSYRFRDDGAGRLVPYVGLGGEFHRWSNNETVLRPHLHAGVDLFATRMIALRLEGQTNWSVPGKASVGLRVGL
jgi:hypothetical protein